MLQKILYTALVVVVVLQFFQIDKSNPEVDSALDFININNPPAEVAEMLKTACYDCHSYQTNYPWYTYTQPLGWWINRHINQGREELNFSEWGNYIPSRAGHKLEEGVELILEEEMPLPSYLRAHPEARLTNEQRKTIADWFEELQPIVYPDSLRELES